jgi:hypothetical protein
MHHHGSQLWRGPAGTRLIFPQKNSPQAADWPDAVATRPRMTFVCDAVAMVSR